MAKPNVYSNKQIDFLIAFSNWEIEYQYGMAAMSQYTQDLELMAMPNGIKPDYAAQRAEVLPSVWMGDKQRIRGSQNPFRQELPKGSISHIQMKGVMRLQDGLSSRGINSIAQDFRDADENQSIISHLFEVDSGGGEAIAGTVIQNTLSDLKKPVVTIGYTVASAALKGVLPSSQFFMVGQDAKVGSVGTMTTLNKRFIRWFQENMEDIYAEDSTEKNLEFREYLKGNKGPIVELLTNTNQYFIQAVLQNRPIKEEAKDQVTAGRLFNAQEAVDNGLIDGLMTFNSAVDAAFEIGQNPASIGRFFQLNSNSMKTNFLKTLIQGINGKLGLSIAEDADQEAVLEAVQKADGVDELEGKIVDTVLQKIKEQGESTKSKPGAAGENQNGNPGEDENNDNPTLEQQVQKLQKQIDDQAKKITTLEQEKKELGKQLVQFVGKVDDTNQGKPNTKDFNVDKFQSLNNFMKAQPEGKGKY